MFVVDTNVLIYAIDADSPYQEPCRKSLEGWRRQQGAWYLTWGVCYEFLRVSTHARVLRAPLTIAHAWQFLASLLASPSIGMLVPTDRHAGVLATLVAEMPDLAGNIVHDVETVVLMREHGVGTIYTRDTDFHRFPFVTAIDPVRASS